MHSWASVHRLAGTRRMISRGQAAVLENPDGHAAMRAWLRLNPGNRKPASIFSLYSDSVANRSNRDRRKSSVFKLEGVGRAGAGIVAKSCNPETAGLERVIYERILPRLPISSLQYYGHVESGESHWLFLEYANGDAWEIDDRQHLELAIRWLAEMHDSAAHLDTLSLLPGRGPEYYLSQLTTARQRIAENISNPALDGVSTVILDEFIACSSLLQARWKEVEAFCRTVPETLVHNDFLGKNVHVRSTKSGLDLLVFDWEMSGSGVPATDLFWLFQHAPEASITRYWEQRRQFNSSIALQDIEYLFVLGAVFRVMDAVEWVSRYLLTGYPNRKIDHIQVHTDRLKHAFQVLGWT